MIEPCIPTRASKPPAGPQWIHKIKHNGYRLIARKRDGRVQLFTRNGFDWTERYPLIREAVTGLRVSALVIDGEAVFCDGDGVANFEKLHSRAYDGQVFLYAFDLLELGGLSPTYRPRKGPTYGARIVPSHPTGQPTPATAPNSVSVRPRPPRAWQLRPRAVSQWVSHLARR
jgi:hypothetical protein